MIGTLGIIGYVLTAFAFIYYFGKVYYEAGQVGSSEEAGLMCVVSVVLGVFWPLTIIYSVARNIL